MRRLMWKTARRFYMVARGEPLRNLPDSSGEIYMQKKVAQALSGLGQPVVFDVGGNLGQWSLQFLELMAAQKAHMDALGYHVFEPVPKTRAKLTENIAAAAYSDIAHIHSVALSDRVGTAKINIMNSPTSGRNSIVDDSLGLEPTMDQIEIETRTLDEVTTAEGIDHVHFIKIDAEGHDFAVISGGADLIAREAVEVIQFEYTKRWIDSRTFLKDVFLLAKDTPYQVVRLRPDGLERFETWHPEMERFFAANYALVHERALDWFDVTFGRFDASNTYA